MIDLQREGEVFVLTMDDDENRWNTTFVRAFSKALDEVEASEGAASLVTTSSSAKFFSNGLDLEWRMSEGEHRGGDRDAFGAEFMTLMGRIKDRHNRFALISHFNLSSYARTLTWLKHHMGKALTFNFFNPQGYYRLNLGVQE